jgi:hypothetical protein
MRKTLALASVWLIAAIPPLAIGDDSAVDKYYQYLPSQILGLPEKERQSKVPMMYIGAANLARSPIGELSIRMNLNSLMYGGMSDLESAIRSYQKDLNQAITGELTVGQIHELGYRAERAQLTAVAFFRSSYQSWIAEDMAFVQGTAKILDDKIAHPINHVRVLCFKDEGHCEYEQFVMGIPDRKSFVQQYQVTEMPTTTYRITRWENGEIEAIPSSPKGCRINQITFNFRTKEFFEIARNNSDGDCKIGSPRLDKPRISQIVDGDPIQDEQFSKIRKEVFDYYSSDFRFIAKTAQLQIEEDQRR